jgi:hypothetical protein
MSESSNLCKWMKSRALGKTSELSSFGHFISVRLIQSELRFTSELYGYFLVLTRMPSPVVLGPERY